MFNDIIEMAAVCEKIVDTFGVVRSYNLFGYIGLRPKVFENSKLSIAKHEAALEITIQDGVTESGHSNPIYMRNNKREVIRTHGEWVYIRDEVTKIWQQLKGLPSSMDLSQLTLEQWREVEMRVATIEPLIQMRAKYEAWLPELFECGERGGGWVEKIRDYRIMKGRHTKALIFQELGVPLIKRDAAGKIFYVADSILQQIVRV